MGLAGGCDGDQVIVGAADGARRMLLWWVLHEDFCGGGGV